MIAGNGMEAIAALSREKFDLVLMDVQMPGMDGLETTRRIRNFNSAFPNKGIPVIVMTGNDRMEAYDECLGAGMNDYITKPVCRDGLFRVLGRWAGSNPKHA